MKLEQSGLTNGHLLSGQFMTSTIDDSEVNISFKFYTFFSKYHLNIFSQLIFHVHHQYQIQVNH